MALGFFPLGLSIVAWEYFLRSARDREIIERVREGVMETIAAKLAKLSHFEHSGIVQIRHDVSNTELKDFMASARHKLLIMVPFFVEPTSLSSVFVGCLAKKNFSFKLLLLRPDSVFLTQRSKVVFRKDYLGRQEVIKTLSVLLAAHEESPAGDPEIRLYDSLPSLFIVQADNRALVGFHLNAGTALDHPHLEIAMTSEGDRPTVLGQMIEAELDRVMADKFSAKLTWSELERMTQNQQSNT